MASIMLKVVGASWYQTRISTCILMGSGLLIIAAFYIAEMERPTFNGTFCATVYWSKNSGFKVEYWKQRNDLENIPKGVARTCYKDSTKENGWSQIEIETQRTYPDWVQAFSAGLLEGSLTWNNIYYHWTNTISSSCDRDENSQNFCTWLRDLLSTNYLKLKEQFKKHTHKYDHYWHQIHLFYYQLEGLEHGWRNGAKRARSDLEDEIPFEDFLLMNSVADIDDLKMYFENFVMRENNKGTENLEKMENFGNLSKISNAKMLIKFIQNNLSYENDDNVKLDMNKNDWQLLFGHSSAGSYSSMLRVQKRYKFHYHFTSDQKTKTVPGVDIAFTSYPGVLASTDDFYIIRGRQVHSLIAGVALKNKNLDLWNSVDLNAMIPLSARVITSNRLSQNYYTWTKTMSRHSVTGSKQWVLVDLRKLDNLNLEKSNKYKERFLEVPPKHLTHINRIDITEDYQKNSNKDIIWVFEQLVGMCHSEDITENLLTAAIDNNYWFANGIPYFDDILNMSKILTDKNDFESTSPLITINITNLDDVEFVLRKNGFRGDLLDKELIPFGNIDVKLFSHKTKVITTDDKNDKNNFFLIAGPLFIQSNQYKKRELQDNNNNIEIIKEGKILTRSINEIDDIIKELERRSIRKDIRTVAEKKLQKPFKWSQVDDSIGSIKHLGHPDEWNFDKVSPKWAWYD